MLINKQYEALLGGVEDTGQGKVQTLFYHLMLLPIWPQDSYFVTRHEGETIVRELVRNRDSIVSAYLTWWPAMIGWWAAVFTVVQALIPEPLLPIEDDPMLLDQPIAVWAFGAFAVLMMMVGVLAHVLTRKALSPAEKKRRAIFAELTGSAADLAQLPDPWSLRDDLKRQVGRIVEQSGIGRDGFERWHDYALDPRLSHPAFLRVVLAIARIYVGHPQDGFAREPMRVLEGHIWDRLGQVDPSLR